MSTDGTSGNLFTVKSKNLSVLGLFMERSVSGASIGNGSFLSSNIGIGKKKLIIEHARILNKSK